MSSSLYGTSDYLPYYMAVVFEKNHCSQTDWRLASLPSGLTMCLDIRNPRNPRNPLYRSRWQWLSWPSLPEGAKRDDIDFYDPLRAPRRCCSFDNCRLHHIDRESAWWKHYVSLKNQVVRVDTVRLFLRKHDVHYSWLVIKLLSHSTDLAAVAVDPGSCWLLVDVLRRIMHSISENCSYRGRSRTEEFPELLRDLSNVWLLLDCKMFYTVVLPDLVKKLPHRSLIYPNGLSRFVTVSTVLIVLQRVSHDFQALMRGDNGNGATFYEFFMRNDDWLIKVFATSVEKCTPVAVLLSLFVPKATVLAACRASSLLTKITKRYNYLHTYIAGAFRYMTLARMSPAKLRATIAASTTDDIKIYYYYERLGTETARLLLELDAQISQEGLAARSLLTLLRTHGIAWVVRHFRESRAMPPSLWTIVHRYFYGTGWRYVYVMEYWTIISKMEIGL